MNARQKAIAKWKKEMKVHVLQHVSFEDIGSIALWFEARRADVSYTRFFENPTLPQMNGLDLIIAMGGPMSVNDEPTLPWLRPEKHFLRDAVERGVPVLGICLGAQLIASAFGSRIYRNSQSGNGSSVCSSILRQSRKMSERWLRIAKTNWYRGLIFRLNRSYKTYRMLLMPRTIA